MAIQKKSEELINQKIEENEKELQKELQEALKAIGQDEETERELLASQKGKKKKKKDASDKGKDASSKTPKNKDPTPTASVTPEVLPKKETAKPTLESKDKTPKEGAGKTPKAAKKA